jgi:hypothetical protein
MAALTVRELDLDNPSDLFKFEQAMYEAFSHYRESIFDNLWVFDHENKRVRTLVPYAGQEIIVAEVKGKVIGAVQLNLDMNAELQIEKIGFVVPKNQGKTAEVLSLFANQMMLGLNLVMLDLVTFADKRLNTWGIKRIWGSCDESLVVPYQTLGFRNVDTTYFNGADEFLLQRDIGGEGSAKISKEALKRMVQDMNKS